MRHKSLMILLLIYLLIASCSNDKGEKDRSITLGEVNDGIFNIDVENSYGNTKSPVKLSSYADEIFYIPLETNEKCLLKEVSKALFTSEYIFITSYKTLYQFDITGKFIRQIGRHGRGPGEYSAVVDFTFIEKTNEIYLHPYPATRNVFIYYAESGNYKRAFDINFNPIRLIEFPSEHLTFLISNNPPNILPDLNSLYFTDLSGRLYDSIPERNKRKEGNIASIVRCYIHNNRLNFISIFTDTL
jgi:hypothetical protein